MLLQVILEGIGLGVLLILVCAIGIRKGAVGMVHLYSPEVQERCVTLGLTTHEKIKRNTLLFKAFDAVPQTEIAKAVYEEAPADGYWFPEVCAGQKVLKDELLGRWKSSDGTQNFEVRARFAGRVLYETTALGVRRNDPLVAYGTA